MDLKYIVIVLAQILVVLGIIYLVGFALSIPTVVENFKVEAFNCLKRIGVPHDPSIPKINASHRPEWFTSYRDIYTPKTAKLVREFYRRDIEEFGYEY